MRGEYDVAAFLAMKAVEVAVRDATNLGVEVLGKDLMRAAFHPERGLLTDMETEYGERQGRSDLFAGAIASYKNPGSHRDVDLKWLALIPRMVLHRNWRRLRRRM
jgi:uncharacterized protein (TIGR02391 family)